MPSQPPIFSITAEPCGSRTTISFLFATTSGGGRRQVLLWNAYSIEAQIRLVRSFKFIGRWAAILYSITFESRCVRDALMLCPEHLIQCKHGLVELVAVYM